MGDGLGEALGDGPGEAPGEGRGDDAKECGAEDGASGGCFVGRDRSTGWVTAGAEGRRPTSVLDCSSRCVPMLRGQTVL